VTYVQWHQYWEKLQARGLARMLNVKDLDRVSVTTEKTLVCHDQIDA
jgi:hypothetical protein